MNEPVSPDLIDLMLLGLQKLTAYVGEKPERSARTISYC